MLACKRADIVLGQRGTCTASAVGGLDVQMNERPLRVGLRHLRRPGGAEVAANEGDESDCGSRPLASRLRHTGPPSDAESMDARMMLSFGALFRAGGRSPNRPRQRIRTYVLV